MLDKTEGLCSPAWPGQEHKMQLILQEGSDSNVGGKNLPNGFLNSENELSGVIARVLSLEGF